MGDYSGLRLPENWYTMIHHFGPIVPRVNHAFHTFPDEPWYSGLGDDLVCEGDWEEQLVSEAMAGRIAWANQGIGPEGIGGFMFIPGDLCRAVGWVGYPGVNHHYADTIWIDIGKELGIASYRPDVMMRHVRDFNDATSNERLASNDPQAYANFKEREFYPLLQKICSQLPAYRRETIADEAGSMFASLETPSPAI